jgi:hypothetical protein
LLGYHVQRTGSRDGDKPYPPFLFSVYALPALRRFTERSAQKGKKQLFIQDALELALMLPGFGFRIAIGVMF